MILGLSVNRTTGIELDLLPAWGQQAEIPNNRHQQVMIALTVGGQGIRSLSSLLMEA